ncbi:MAG: pyridoxal phosphate-dependent aminotransferase [Proteobacteria bacterium]|nr:pyridoxal phosphate-dependent aminotransferase [Pseudomonadota bacterium]
MLTPEGKNAKGIDLIMLLATWAFTEGAKHIAGIGKPTFPASFSMIITYLEYFQRSLEKAQAEHTLLEKPNTSIIGDGAISYTHPQGLPDARNLMAEAMTNWYHHPITKENILFTTGGAGALNSIFNALHDLYGKKYPRYRLISPVPYYTLYDNEKHDLFPIEVMKESGYQLTADALKKSIEQAYLEASFDKKPPKAVLLCNPNNPLGTMISEEELKKIAEVLREYPDLHIIFDEAYAEMAFEKIPHLLEIAPNLANRMIIIRSATKGLSVAGERAAVAIVLDTILDASIVAKNIEATGHSSISTQVAYATTMHQFDEQENQKSIDFYKAKVEYVTDRIKKMGASLPDKNHKIQGTFYAVLDLSDMFGLEIPSEAKKALEHSGKIKTDEDLAYSLIFQDKIMIAPLSYYGLDPKLGFMRITCSASEEQLAEMMNHIEARLFEGRTLINTNLKTLIEEQLEKTNSSDKETYQEKFKKIKDMPKDNCLSIKAQNDELKELLHQITYAKFYEPENEKSVKIIQGFFKKTLAQKKLRQWKETKEWVDFINDTFVDDDEGPSEAKLKLLAMPAEKRLSFKPWKQHIEQKATTSSNKDLG